jgi:phosphopantetheinyl transferase (holo-ACP synthase)
MAAKEATAKAVEKSVEITVTMTKDKVTKNAVRYQEDEVKGQAPQIGTLYIQKHALPDEPEHVTVTITAG